MWQSVGASADSLGKLIEVVYTPQRMDGVWLARLGL